MAGAQTTILLVEDEPAIADLLSFTLEGYGWSTAAAGTAREAWSFLQRDLPQLILLDWMLPDQTGIQFLSRIRADRQFQALPVIMLTAKSAEADKIIGFDSGADDYITKPFSPRELATRVHALLRRKNPEHAQEMLKVGPIVLDPVSCTVSVNGRRVDIGQSEYRLLKFFMAHPERVHSRSQLLGSVWGNYVMIEERTVDVHVLRLRKALKEAETLLQTVRGVGYRLSED